MSSTATTTVKTKQRSTSSASQKFWPLKKFGLHHGKTEEQQQQQQSIQLTSNKNNKEPPPSAVEPSTNKANKHGDEKDHAAQQKKTKNKRLSSLLSSNRRQEENNFKNLQSHVNTPESIAADNTKKQINNASNTPTLTRKSGREISNRTRTTSQNTTNTAIVASPKHGSNMTAKSAGSGTLSRSNNMNSLAVTPPSSTVPLNGNKARSRELRNNSIRRSSEDRLLKRPQSPPAKRNDSPTAQPNIMLDSVQKRIQNEYNSSNNKREDSDVDNDSAIEEDNSDGELEDEKSIATIISKAANNKPINEKFDTTPAENNEKLKVVNNEEYEIQKQESNDNSSMASKKSALYDPADKQQQEQKIRSPLPSPPITPAATNTVLPEFTKTRDTETFSASVHIHSEPASPTIYSFDVTPMHHYKVNDIDLGKQDSAQSLFSQQQQQSIHRIQRLRPAASFATLRQLASTNNTYQSQHQHQQLSQPQHSQQQMRALKRRPVSYIESSSQNSYLNYASDEFLTVHRPTYYRRASSEDNRHFHSREQSDNTSTTTAATFPSHVGSRGLIRSNTVHNLIIRDGQGHRIVQCLGLDETPTLRRKTSGFEGKELFQKQQDWSPPPESLDEYPLVGRQQQLEEQQYHHEQLLLIQQQQIQQQQLHHLSGINDNNTDTSSSDSSSHHTSGHHRRIKRKDSAKSISSLCSSSPPIMSYDSRFEKLRNKLDQERATVKALQKQKEACNKDILFLNKSVDELTAENTELKKKFEVEKNLKERFQDDLSSTLDKLNEATEHIRQLENQGKVLKAEIDDKIKEIREHEKQKQQQSIPKGKSLYLEGKSTDRLLAAQLLHSQNQVRLLKSTMEQFLRMGVFNDDLNSSHLNMTSPTTSIETVASEIRSVGRSRQRRSSSHNSKSSTTSANEDISAPITSPVSTKSRKSLVPSVPAVPVIEPVNVNKTSKTPEKKSSKPQDETTAELDIQFRELLREKEILQAEYSKAPSSGGNALVRRRREELESRLDTVDSQMCRIKLQMRSRNIL